MYSNWFSGGMMKDARNMESMRPSLTAIFTALNEVWEGNVFTGICLRGGGGGETGVGIVTCIIR